MSQSNITDNKNFLAPGNFKVTIDSSEYANIQFFCTSASVPSISQAPVSTSFKNFNAHDMLYTVNRAIGYYHEKELWNKLIIEAMSRDYSWAQSAFKYNRLYAELIARSGSYVL